ncbi:MAG TPA: hypothetical protein VKY89_16375 [Thermoanaerobaculia bacterium]|jgi:hypothetical protein|nr:hypothetical protein [Thermoanaerobaculia bacterium]
MSWLTVAWLLGAPIQLVEAADGRRSAMNPSWVVVPGKAVGPIQIGMSQEEVRAAVGEAERTSHGGWEYSSGGYAVLLDQDRHTVNAIVGGDVGYPHGALVKAFVARTREGIGMGSTRVEVVKALGVPDADRKPPGGEVLSYPGLELVLVDGAVAHLTVWRVSKRR